MGKAARNKRGRPTVNVPTARPRWAGADGFDSAWRLAESYIAAGDALEQVAGGAMTTDLGRAVSAALQTRSHLLSAQVSTLTALIHLAEDDGGLMPQAPAGSVRHGLLPGRLPRAEAGEDTATFAARHRPYAHALRNLATGHREALRMSTPILFDPLTAPAVDDDVSGLRLPFDCVTCDFLTAQGMSMPITASTTLRDSEWVGLVAATLRQQADDIIDVWPVVKVLRPSKPDDEQAGDGCLMFGRVRFGGNLGEPPPGITEMQIEDASTWSIAQHDGRSPAVAGHDDWQMWALLWLVQPAKAAISALRLLDAVNVDLAPATLSRPVRRRGAREGAEIPLEVVIRTSRTSSTARPSVSVEWQHRWTVRGHWKHFTKGPLFNANPRRRVFDADGREVVKVWCPPFVKGPQDKPLVLKARHVRET